MQGRLHIAFGAEDRESVDAFHAAALDAGGTDNGSPGVRDIYHPDYYGAYVLDPDGHNIEAVCHTPVSADITAALQPAQTQRISALPILREPFESATSGPYE